VFLEAVELLAHLHPLRVAEDAAHVIQHHQLPVEETRTRVAHACRSLADRFAIQLRLIELGPQRDVRLLELRAMIDQLVHRLQRYGLQLRLLVLGEAQHLNDLGAPPPLPGRKIHRRRRAGEGEECDCNEDQAFHQSFFPSSTHDSHSTTLWKSLNCSLCHGSCDCCCGSSAVACCCCGAGACAGVLFDATTLSACFGSVVFSVKTLPRKNARTAAAATRKACPRFVARSRPLSMRR